MFWLLVYMAVESTKKMLPEMKIIFSFQMEFLKTVSRM